MSDNLLEKLQAVAVAGEVACVDAHEVASEMGLSPQQLSVIVNRDSALRFTRCQLGLFGYGLKSEGKSKIVLAATNVPEDLKEALLAAAPDGRHIDCADAWKVADVFKYPRLGVANVMETLGLRVTPCQLGCF